MYKVLTHSCFAIVHSFYPTLRRLHYKLSPRLTGLPFPADWATRLGGSPHLSCKRDQGKIRDYMDVPKVPHLNVNRP